MTPTAGAGSLGNGVHLTVDQLKPVVGTEPSTAPTEHGLVNRIVSPVYVLNQNHGCYSPRSSSSVHSTWLLLRFPSTIPKSPEATATSSMVTAPTNAPAHSG